MEQQTQALTLVQLNTVITNTIAAQPALRDVWVVAETSDVRIKGGHCYLELMEKDENGNALARMKANIWARTYAQIAAQFRSVTNTEFTSGIKVMVRLSVSYHPSYGLSASITGVNPSYTLGDAVRRRNEILARLKAEQILDLNKHVAWRDHTWRVAVVSAQGAAGYGDFINQLYNNGLKLRFKTGLFTATLQGERTAPTVIAALQKIAQQRDQWDVVVVIRGGGSTGDLSSFDNYDIAATIARFPLPVIVGIGHERDVTVLDYVANQRVKTPTAAAQLLIQHGGAQLTRLSEMASTIYRSVVSQINANREHLAFLDAQIPAGINVRLTGERHRFETIVNAITTSATAEISRHRDRLSHTISMIGTLTTSKIQPNRERLDVITERLCQAIQTQLDTQKRRLETNEALVNVLSPQAIIDRGFSITVDTVGKPINDLTRLRQGQEVMSYTRAGIIRSAVVAISPKAPAKEQPKE